IVEELSPDDREAIFQTIDSEVAADALSEIDPGIQASILESLEAGKAADIVEEMAPNEAADLLGELEEETSEEILDEMEPEPKTEVRELLEFEEDSAGGMMNTEYVALPGAFTVDEAMEVLKGAVPLAKLFVASGTTPLRDLSASPLLHVNVEESQDRITELFDKYNLL